MASEELLKITHKGLELELVLSDVKDLLLHEEISPYYLDELKTRIRSDEAIKHPLVVDKATLITLDGTHRVVAAREVGLRWVPACVVDYKNPAIRVDRWYRTLLNLPSKELLCKVLKTKEVRYFEVPRDKAEETIGEAKAAMAILTGKWCLAIGPGDISVRERYRICGEIEKVLIELGVVIDYKDPLEAVSLLEKKVVDAIIALPTIDKDLVVKECLSGNLFPPKSTRHIVPGRFLNLFAPLGILKTEDLDRASERLAELIKEKKLKLLPPGSVVGRRRYEEEVYVFE